MARQKESEPDPIEVDEHHLDREWTAQPRLMRQAARRLADARHDERMAKAKVDLVEAELSLAIRRTPERYGFTGARAPSNDVVAAAVVVQQEYRIALQEYNTARHASEVLEAEVSALQHKKAALENAVILWCRDYGAECKVPREHEQSARDKLGSADRWRNATRDVE